MNSNTQNTFETFVSSMIAEYNEELDEKFVRDFMFSLESEEKFCIPSEKLLEWKVFKHKSDIKKRMLKLNCKEGQDFSEMKLKSTGGRPSMKITLTVDCFKKMCVMANNTTGEKVRSYYLILEKLFKKYTEDEFIRQMTEKDKQLECLAEKVHEEQSVTIKAQKSLLNIQKKFTHRYKFPKLGCVYILKDPDCKYDKHKIGFSSDINQRLMSDRTMVPSIQVIGVFYTPHYELFEKVIKTRYADRLELPSHEWVFASEEELTEGYKELNKACCFNATEEKNLWRYNMEEPPEKICIKENKIEITIKTQRKRKEPKNIPKYQNHLEKDLAGILPSRILRHGYRLKTKLAPDNQRYCNGFCQVYQPLESFNYRSESLMTICTLCESMVDVAKDRMKSGWVTVSQICKDPSILKIDEDEMLCRKCNIVKNKSEFTLKRRQCKKCRQSVRSKYGENFDDNIEDEVKLLQSIGELEMKKKLGIYIKIELYKIASYVKVGRKYNDNKKTMFDKLVHHFTP
jgi:phage anti-repressor protein